MISGYVDNGKFDEARDLYERMPNKNVVAMTAMITGYFKEGRVEDARVLFDGIRYKDLVCWNAMITGNANSNSFIYYRVHMLVWLMIIVTKNGIHLH